MIFHKDIEQCPYTPSDPEYEEWMKKDQERLNNLYETRKDLWETANHYLSHQDRNVRNMAVFITGLLREN